MTRILFFLSFLWFSHSAMMAQMNINGEELYGYEWIDYDQEYYTIEVTNDGIYRLGYEALQQAGLDVSGTELRFLQLFSFGQEVPFYATTDSFMEADDFILFIGNKQRNELDRHLYEDEQVINPQAALYDPTARYFLTIGKEDGLRIQSVEQTIPPSIDPMPWYWHKEIVDNHLSWIKGETGTQGIQSSVHESSEGWGTGLNARNTLDIITDQFFDGNEDLTVRFHVTGTGIRSVHETEYIWNSESISTQSFSRATVTAERLTIPSSDVNPMNTIQVNGIGAGTPTDRVGVGALEYEYPRILTSGSKQLIYGTLPEGNTGLLRWSEINAQAFIYFPSRNVIKTGIDSGTDVLFNVEDEGESSFILWTENRIEDLSAPAKIEMKGISNGSAAEYLIITHSALRTMHEGEDWVQAYADYRSSPDGGNYNVLVLDIEDLSNEFSYGSSLHPLSIKNFSNHAQSTWPNLKQVLLLGKSLQYNLDDRNDVELNKDLKLLPTFGVPCSDNLLFTQKNEINSPVAFGRVPARNPREIQIYLNKVFQYELNLTADRGNTAPKNWTKRILHLGGGNGTSEPILIESALEDMENLIEEGQFGADIFTHTKQSSEVIEDVPPASIASQWLDDGVIMKTYFGHGSVTTVQFQNLESPSAINNVGRYPVMNAWGCETGNCFVVTDNSLGERNLFAPSTGGISYSATSGLGSIPSIRSYGTTYYRLLADDFATSPIGLAHREALDLLKSSNGFSRIFLEQLIFMGDPALRLSASQGPDYTFNSEQTSISPAVVNLEQSTFELNVSLFNLGLNTEDSLDLFIQWELPDGTIKDGIKYRVPAPRFSETISLVLNNQGEESIGKNRLYISIDPDNAIEEFPSEIAEFNNDLFSATGELGYDFFVVSGGINIIYPPQYAILNKDMPFHLKISTQNALKDSSEYLFEMSTSSDFSTTIYKEQVYDYGGVIQSQPAISLQEGEVYFWRVAESVSDVNTLDWSTSSFVYLPDSKMGWNQSHPDQFRDNTMDSMLIESNGSLTYRPDRVIDYTFDLSYREERAQDWILIDGINWGSLNPRDIGSVVAVHIRHPELDILARSVLGQYGSINYRDFGYFYSMDSIEDRRNLMELIDAAPVDSRILIYSIINEPNPDFDLTNWESDQTTLGRNLFSYFESLGSEDIRTLERTGTVPFYIIIHKGVGVVAEEISTGITDPFTAEYSVPINKDEGSFEVVPIGPAKEWLELELDLREYDDVQDSVSLTVNETVSGSIKQSTELIFPNTQTDFSPFDLNNQSQIQLRYYSKDLSEAFDPIPQVEFITALYEPLDELALDPNYYYASQSQTIRSGENLKLAVGIENISGYDVRDVVVQYTLRNNTLSTTEERIVSRLEPYGHAIDSITLSTEGFEGMTSILIQINPDNVPKEQFTFNNVLSDQLFIKRDVLSPGLLVTFDRREIKNRDQVSNNPHIRLQLVDQNSILELGDTSVLSFTITDPNGNDLNLNYQTNDVTFESYSIDANTQVAIANINTLFNENGVYTLTVAAQDVSGNHSGVLDYRIEFLIDDSTVSHINRLSAHPNPANQEIYFDYSLQGASNLESYEIQITNSIGQVVNRLSTSVLGEATVGNNSFNRSWNLTDFSGNKLLPGIYFYTLLFDQSILSTGGLTNEEIKSITQNTRGTLLIVD